MAKLSSIAYYVTDKISSNDISLAEYVTTDCILQNRKGREVATNLPPQPCSLIRYQRGDVLIANTGFQSERWTFTKFSLCYTSSRFLF